MKNMMYLHNRNELGKGCCFLAMETRATKNSGTTSNPHAEGYLKRLAVYAHHLANSPHYQQERPCLERLHTLSLTSNGAVEQQQHRNSLTITDNRTGKQYQLPISQDHTVKASDFKQIKAEDSSGLKLYDPGYLNTAPVRSSVYYIDGEKGILRYRGYPIEELAEKSSFTEVAYLLVYGNLPTKDQLSHWEAAIALPEGVLDVIAALPHDVHPMGALVGVINALGSFHPDANPALKGQDLYQSKSVRDKQIVRILGKVPTLAAAIYLRMAGRHPVIPWEIYELLHCCCTPPRLQWSGCIHCFAGAAGALYGPLHGGANEAVLKMLSEIGTVEKIPEFLDGVKNRKRKMSGFGHRVYKNYDPRAKVVKKLAEEVFSIVGRDPLIEVAVALEAAALSDEYFVKRQLYPNVDFYSGLIYRALGFPPEYFTVLFAIPRMAGYLAHWKESLDDPDSKIMRPQQSYVGAWLRQYTPSRSRTTNDSEDRFGEIATSNATRRRKAGVVP
ncbi:hypothetical protein GOP47_0015497 [Adiantum capillus-veneris]|uniref:citrate synthase (unknown stereospecificity) n=1 Tax=Adiantum capillus-veneris TaxID=13818 RepID=A0A9D4UKQ5_ADICA|nr:hypothetical protein GOP47_0015497 [Adiantum capillus-veneris]